MKYVKIVGICDMTRAETGKIEEAAETVYLALGRDPKNLKVRELDLTEDWSRALHEVLLPYLNASHEPGELVTPDAGGHPDGDGDTPRKAARRYNKAQLAWARERGYNVTLGVRGKHYFPRKTRTAYAHHLDGRDDLLTEANGLAPDYDPAAAGMYAG